MEEKKTGTKKPLAEKITQTETSAIAKPAGCKGSEDAEKAQRE